MRLVRWKNYNLINIVFIIIWLFYFFCLFEQPYIGIIVSKNSGSWVVTRIDLNGEGYKFGIRVGDKIVNVDNKDLNSRRSVNMWREIEGVSKLKLVRDNKIKEIIIPKKQIISTLIDEGPMLILSVVFWILGVITFYKRPFLKQSRKLFWLNYFIGLAIIIAPASSRQLLLGRELELIIFSILPTLLVNLILVFPVEKTSKSTKNIQLIVGSMSFLVAFLVILKLAGLINLSSEIKQLALTIASVGSLVTLLYLLFNYFSSNTKQEKNQIIYVFVGLALGVLPFILFTAIPIVLHKQPILYSQISVLFVSIIPIIWSYVIIQKYIPDGRDILEILLKNVIAASIISGISPYLVLKMGFIKKVTYENFINIFTILFFLIMTYSAIKTLIGRLFIRVVPISKIEFKRKIEELNKKIVTINDDILAEKIMEDLELEGVFIIAEYDQGAYQITSGTFKNNCEELTSLHKLYYQAKSIGRNAMMLTNNSFAEVFLPFYSKNFCCGIFLGHRCSKVKFNNNELPQLLSVCYQVVQSLKSNYQIKMLTDEINSMAKQIMKNNLGNQGLKIINMSLIKNIEKEKKVIASEIHDGPLQLILFISRKLKIIREDFSYNNNLNEYIVSLQGIVDELNFELRSLCSDLRPASLTDLGLVPAIENLCNEIMKRELIQISLITDNINRDQRFNEDIELGAFRFVQEGLNNVIKHAKTSYTEICLSIDGGFLVLQVNDNGIGFEVEKIEDLILKGNHLGIIGLKERFKGLGGEFIIKSKIGKGVKITAMVPIC